MSGDRLLHAGCVLLHGVGILIIGDSGSGKSSLAAGLMVNGAQLVGDDQLLLSSLNNRLYARPPHTIKGKMELFGFGVIDVPTVASGAVPISYALHCVANQMPQRMPDEACVTYLDIAIPMFQIDPHHPSTLAKVLLFTQSFTEDENKNTYKAIK